MPSWDEFLEIEKAKGEARRQRMKDAEVRVAMKDWAKGGYKKPISGHTEAIAAWFGGGVPDPNNPAYEAMDNHEANYPGWFARSEDAEDFCVVGLTGDELSYELNYHDDDSDLVDVHPSNEEMDFCPGGDLSMFFGVTYWQPYDSEGFGRMVVVPIEIGEDECA